MGPHARARILPTSITKETVSSSNYLSLDVQSANREDVWGSSLESASMGDVVPGCLQMLRSGGFWVFTQAERRQNF